MEIFAPLHHSMEPTLIRIEVSLHFQIPSIKIIGLVSHDVLEAKERIFAAFAASGLEFPKRKILINLPPASLSKKGTHFDLPMALAIYAASQKKSTSLITQCAASGELSLNGHVKASGKLFRILMGCRLNKIQTLILSIEEQENCIKALQTLSNLSIEKQHIPKIYFISKLSEIKNLLQTKKKITQVHMPAIAHKNQNEDLTLSEEIQLAPLPKTHQRTLMTSLLGYHHLLILGPKGVGKSSFLTWSECFFSPHKKETLIENHLLRELKNQKPLHVNSHKVGPLVRPYALVGSCTKDHIYPGAYSLSHGKLLLADEFLEWHKDSIETLREPLENRKVTLNRLNQNVFLPAHFLFIGTANLCPCGGYPKSIAPPNTENVSLCQCTDKSQKNYMQKVSGAIYERIDLVFFMWESPQNHKNPSEKKNHLISKKLIEEKRNKILEKHPCLPGLFTPLQCELYLKKNPQTEKSLAQLLKNHSQFDNFRNRHKTLKVALTLSLIDDSQKIELPHLSEALSYRFQP